jgi:xanthine dehydrogenase accessory factor
VSTPDRLPTPAEVLAEASRRLERGESVALCTVARCEGSTPGKPGWRLLVDRNGAALGNLGGGAFEALATHDAKAALKDGAPSTVKRYYLTEEATRGEATGMVCGGFVEVLLEVLGARPQLVIFGAGPVGRAIAAVATIAGFACLVVDDRNDFLDPAAFPSGTTLVPASEQPLANVGGRYLAVAVVTRCWETDLAALRQVVTAAPPHLDYLGLMGSRRKIARIREVLSGEGVDLDSLGLRAPIGLPIGGDSPGEIAVAVVAEVIAARSRV